MRGACGLKRADLCCDINRRTLDYVPVVVDDEVEAPISEKKRSHNDLRPHRRTLAKGW